MHPCRSLSLVLILATCGVAGAETEVVRARAVEAPTVVAPEAFNPTLAATEMEQLFARLAAVEPEARSVIDLGPLSTVEEAVLRGDEAIESRRLLVGIDRQVGMTVDLASLDHSRADKVSAIGELTNLPDGSVVWSMSFRSPGATAVRAHLSDVALPPNAGLYVYSPFGEAFGPYTGRGTGDRNELWTNTVAGDQITVQLELGAPVDREALYESYFVVESIGHMGDRFELARWRQDVATKSFCNGSGGGPANASCVQNASCSSLPSAIQGATGAIAEMLFASGSSYYICTGGLLNNTQSTFAPYFLTANHCISNSNEASSLETYWDFTAPCGTTACGYAWDGGRATPGASILSGSSTSDYTLLQLASIPSGRTFLGWTSAAVAYSNGAGLHRISHPSGAPQAYSTQAVNTSAGTCGSWPRGNWIYSRDTYGATEGGSSGSPVMNSSGQVVGQLSGACGTNLNDVCDSTHNATVDGAFANYYSNVAQWLDPSGGCIPSTEVCDGVDNDCDGQIDEDGVCGGGCTLGQTGDSCSSNSDCCSNRCRGRRNRKTCR
jgi:V8-like Glu-specific endopeptidase